MRQIILESIKFIVIIAILSYFIYVIYRKVNDIKKGNFKCYGCDKDCKKCINNINKKKE